WSRRTLLDLLGRELAGARLVALIDYHTGLGPPGYGERITGHAPGSVAERRVAEWYGGDFTNPAAGTSSSAVLNGTNWSGLLRAFPQIDWGMIALEYGTVPVREVLESLRADNWLHCHGDAAPPLGRDIKAGVRHAFYGRPSAAEQGRRDR